MKAGIISVLCTAILFCYRHAEAQYQVRMSVLSNGGAASNNSSYTVAGTAGQPLVGSTSSSSHFMKAGFWFLSRAIVTVVEDISHTLPTEFRLEQNYPNPFNASTVIRFALPEPSAVTLRLFDVLGREVGTVVDKKLQPGEYKIHLEAKDLPSGVYIYQLQAGSFVQHRKMVLTK